MKIGQLLISGLEGVSLNQMEKDLIKKSGLGGVLLRANNYESPAQLAELVNEIQSLRSDEPLFISIDHEGGRVHRFKNSFTKFPAMLDIAKLNSPKTVFEVYEIMGQELSACGINLSYSPVCDVLTNPENKVIGDRAFGTDAETVEKYISAAIRGLQSQGVLACAKHFPGHGSTKKDSHFDLPIVKTKMEDLEKCEFIPFYKATKSKVEFVMMAHLIVDCIDEKWPCSLSKKAHQLLRDKLKFDRIIISDDMEMQAITDSYSLQDALLMNLDAGGDIVVYRTSEKAALAWEALLEIEKTKKIKAEELKEKVNRVQICKEKHFSQFRMVSQPRVSEVFSSTKNKNYLDQLKAKINSL